MYENPGIVQIQRLSNQLHDSGILDVTSFLFKLVLKRCSVDKFLCSPDLHPDTDSLIS